jgi:hypothetical protein
MAKRSLSDLLKQADELLGKSSSEVEKTASPVDQVAALLEGASEEVSLEGAAPSTDFEKVALSLNRLHTANCLDTISKVASFEEKARAEGFDENQIQEALAKTAAKQMLDHLPLLVAMTDLPMQGKDKNKLKATPSEDKKQKRLPITENMGY